MKALRFCLVLLLVAGTSSAAPANPQKPYPAVTAVINGVKTITNPDYPRDGRFIAKLTVEMSCGEEGGAPGGVLNKPFRLAADDHGDIYVSDYGDSNIKVYDGQGRFLRAIGRQGQGPGEFGGTVFFAMMSGGRLCVLDFTQKRVIILKTDGQYVSGFPCKEFYASMGVDAQDRLFLGTHGPLKDIDKLSADFQEVPYVTKIYRTDAAGQTPVHLVDFLGESLAMKSMPGGVISRTGPNRIVWVVRHDGKVCGGYNLDYSVGVYGENGDKELTFGRQFTPLKSAGSKGMDGEKKAMPAYGGLAFDEAGNIWVETSQPEDAKGFVYDVFSPDGIYVKQVGIEQRIGCFKNGKLYMIFRPEEAYPSIKRCRMELMPAGK